MPSPTFHFFTLVTRDDQYDAMRASLAEVGFEEANSVFTLLDNRTRRDAHEPYSAITAAVERAEAPYVVFCHQDLVFLSGPEALLEAIAEVEAIDPNWAVLGNAGYTPGVAASAYLDDHSGSHHVGTVPALAITLDENFLVIRRDSGVGCSPDLSGFHLYATDLVLNAYRSGLTAYVLRYRVVHRSTTLDYGGLHRMAPAFARVWKAKGLSGAVVQTPAAILVFSRVPLLFAFFNRASMAERFRTRFLVTRTMDHLLRHGRPQWLPMGRYDPEDPNGPRTSGVGGRVDRLLNGRRPQWPSGLTYVEVPRWTPPEE